MTAWIRPRSGFTLVEMLVVFLVLGILASLTMNAVQSARAAASRLACGNNLRQLSLAFQHYHQQNSRFLPAYAPYQTGSNEITWTVMLLPYIEHEPLYRTTLAAHATGKPPIENPPHVGLATVVTTYTCAADGRLALPITDDKGYTAAYGSFMGVAGDGLKANGAMRALVGVQIGEVTDGSSNTLLLGERTPSGRLLSGNWYTVMVPDVALTGDPTWAGPGISYLSVANVGSPFCNDSPGFGPGRVDNPCDALHFWSVHSGGANFAFCDGSVRFLRYEANSIMPALATRAGGEVVDLP